jgi:two-component system alkaline phosphatase synthesis response regulator PhoP
MATILIVEDEANIRKFVSANLAARGYDVIETDNAREGLDRLRDSSPAILLLDLRMPGMSGLDLLGIVSEDPELADIPIIVLTASQSQADIVSEEFPHVIEVLMKPVKALRLVATVASALEER